MYYYLKGTLAEISSGGVVIDVNGVGYFVSVSHLEDYTQGESLTLYTYLVVREDEQFLVGFRDREEKDVFRQLISVKGIGPRTALNALSAVRPADLVRAIAANNVTFLKKLPGIGAKAAAQIILDLKGQLSDGSKGNPEQYDEVREALKGLGFRVAEIDRVLATINELNATSEDILRLALAKLRK